VAEKPITILAMTAWVLNMSGLHMVHNIALLLARVITLETIPHGSNLGQLRIDQIIQVIISGNEKS
jgi:hypothetical protein